jgi:hypothetical protein
MGLPELLTGQFIFSLHPNNRTTLYVRLPEKNIEKNMIITIPSLIAAGIATAVVTGGITGTAVYLRAGDVDVVTGDQIKTEGGLHILELGHMEPWAIAMMCATLLIGMGTCGACCHKRGKSYVRDKEEKLRDRALGRAKELVHMKAHGADRLLEDIQTYHDMHNEIVVQKMHQITPPRTGGRHAAERPCVNPQCGDCAKPRHIAVGFSNKEQKAAIIREPAPSPPPAASSPSLGMDGEADSSPPRSIAARRPSPPRSIAARTPSPLTIIETRNDPFANNATKALFISPHLGKWDPIANGSKVTQEDTDKRRQEDINCMLKRQREQNERDMQDIPGYVARKERSYAKLYARERILERQAEQRQRKVFKDLQEQENKQKLRRPFDPISYKPLPMGLSFTSEDWMRDSDTWNKEHILNWNREKRIIHVVSDDDKMESYFFEGEKLYRIPQRRPRRTDETYEEEDRDLAAGLSRNAAAAAATAADTADAWE